MSAGDVVREFFGLGPNRTQVAEQMLTQANATFESAGEYVREGMMSALSIALEDRGWLRVDGFDRDEAGNHLTFQAIKAAGANGSALVQGNPIMHRAVDAQAGYVWGDGFRITGADKIIKNPKNKKNIFSRAAQLELETTKAATGNVLIVVDDDNTMWRIPFYEIQGAVYDPQDRSSIWYFYRVWTEQVPDFETGKPTPVERKMLYPRMDYTPPNDGYPDGLYGMPVYSTGVVKHVAPHKLVGGAWGLPDLLAGIFYATEHKQLLEAADSIFRAQSQYAVAYKGKTRKAVEAVAAEIAGPAPVDPRTGEPMQYGQTAAFGNDIEMQLMQKIGAGIDFNHFDPIAGLASVVLGIPLEVVLGQETKDTALPFTTKRTMRNIQQMWEDAFQDIFDYMVSSKKAKEVKMFWPRMDPDPTFRQVQSIAGVAQLRVASPEQILGLVVDTFGVDWDPSEVADPKKWDKFLGIKNQPIVAGSTEPNQSGSGGTQNITGGQGQTGQVGKLSDGDHSLRDQGQQDHTKK